ncbi:ATP-binding cassette domain-containing protein [Frankia sp. Ag45/Mut15]|uniref:ATP-binding cassette domain-containing protein n=1 Tax=Frankia umida TaxID=573489 RepID=A0ABT0JZU2_9ACTN|nr:ATP-binding cassette domain-containing protein [Frankia umida]MCK9877052.1 ATP-binding cassette domain-containing protein [Frankia umida]
MIEARGLTKRYGFTAAVDDLTFTLTSGSVTGLLGPNGAGKSTLMRMIVGLDVPSAGTVTVGGRSLRQAPAPMREVGALLDARAFDGALTARAHLRWLARAGGLPAARVDEALAEAGLTSVARTRVRGFSLGMSQRLGIAAALLGDPAVLIFDEPANGLDPEGIRWIRVLIRRLAGEGRTILVSSHLMSEVEGTVDQVIVMGRGRIVADGSIRDFTRRGSATHVEVVSPRADELAAHLTAAGAQVKPADPGGPGGPSGTVLKITGLTVEQVGDLALTAGIALHTLVERAASLEEAFMEITQNSVQYRPEPAR